jgi:hypothetical protein
MSLLERGFRGGIRGAKPPEKRCQSNEAGFFLAQGTAQLVLRQAGRHTGVVVEASDVRGDGRRREHILRIVA